MVHTGGSKSFARLMAEKTKDGVESSCAKIFIEIHKQRKDGRPIDSESAQKIVMMQEKLSNNQHNDEESRDSVAWDGDIYSQVMEAERAGQV
ncbi:putative ovule protein [Cocos nucifera]|uniref:Putative ovule protein n=1 Tax=Cocos nucifera TaxID=13894 RepID=A0A8K0N8G7_COCNU|nr:putative ovule protein [Cocos nucifera]